MEKKNVAVIKDKLNLSFLNRDVFACNEYDDVFNYIMRYSKRKAFTEIEIDLGKQLFDVTDLLKMLLANSNIFRLGKTQIILNLGELNLERRIEYLRCFSNLNINRFEINYYKKDHL